MYHSLINFLSFQIKSWTKNILSNTEVSQENNNNLHVNEHSLNNHAKHSIT